MAGIMDFFKGGSTASQPQNQPATQPAAPAATNNAGTQQPSATPDGKMPGTNQVPSDPLAAYANMFKKSEGEPDTPPAFKIDDTTLKGVSSSLQLTQGLDPALMARVQSGDTGALMEIINVVGQRAYENAIRHNTALTDKFVGMRSEYERNHLPAGVRKELTNNALSATPNYSNPVVKAQLNEIADRLQRSHPDASPQEIASMSQQYLIDLAAALNPNSGSVQGSNSSQGDGSQMDWATYLTQ